MKTLRTLRTLKFLRTLEFAWETTWPIILGVLLCFAIAGGAEAQTMAVGDLTGEQKAQLEVEAAKLRAKNAADRAAKQEQALKSGSLAETAKSTVEAVAGAMPTPQKVDEWSQVGANIGKGLVAAAKEIGTATVDFSKTDLGKITVGVIVWKVLGRELTDTAAGIVRYFTHLFAALLFPLVWFMGTWYYIKIVKITGVTRTQGKIFSYVSKIDREELSQEEKASFVVAAIVAFVGAVASLATI